MLTDMPHIIVTGGCGFIGSHVTQRLLDTGFSVSVIDDNRTGNYFIQHDNVEYYQKDVATFNPHQAFIEPPIAIIHLANSPRIRRALEYPTESIVNNIDILSALESKKISSFVTDFPTPELVNRSIDYSDVILLPHLGASTKEAEINCAIMAAEQANNFLINGEIINSVNFPRVRLRRTTKNRLVIVHKDEPGLIGSITGELASKNINISDMINKSSNEIAITLIDIEIEPSKNLLSNINKIDKVLSVRCC